MFRNLSFLGFSMRERAHRRTFVVLTYVVMTTALILAVSYRDVLAMSIIAVVWLFVPLLIFGTVVTPYLGMVPLMGPHPPHRVDRGLGLAASVPPEEPGPDEHDIAVRNAAYYVAYWALTICCLGFLGVLQWTMTSTSPHRRDVLTVAFQLLLVLLMSLPQAVVLWTERDIHEEPASI